MRRKLDARIDNDEPGPARQGWQSFDFQIEPCLRALQGGALVVWPGMTFPTSHCDGIIHHKDFFLGGGGYLLS